MCMIILLFKYVCNWYLGYIVWPNYEVVELQPWSGNSTDLDSVAIKIYSFFTPTSIPPCSITPPTPTPTLPFAFSPNSHQTNPSHSSPYCPPTPLGSSVHLDVYCVAILHLFYLGPWWIFRRPLSLPRLYLLLCIWHAISLHSQICSYYNCKIILIPVTDFGGSLSKGVIFLLFIRLHTEPSR